MFAPTLQSKPLGISRQDNAINRGADAIYDALEWQPTVRLPAAPGIQMTRERLEANIVARRVLFTGRFWMADEPVAAWRAPTTADAAQRPFRPVSQLAARAIEAGQPLKAAGACRGELIPQGKFAAPAPKNASCYSELALAPLDGAAADLELASVNKLTLRELRVEVVKFLKPAPHADGVVTGRVLAVSENYSAQDIGGNRVVVHDNKSLDRPVSPGDKVTMTYEGGKASVYDGLLHDINIVADWMPAEHQGYLRMVMLDALSMMKEPQSEEQRLQDAMRYALESTANFFGLSETKLRAAEINLVVNEQASVYKAEGDTADGRAPARTPRP